MRSSRPARSSTEGTPRTGSLDTGPVEGGSSGGEPAPDEDWFGSDQPGEDSYAARMDVSLACMLMLGASPYQRIDGMGLARKALEEPSIGDSRRDISVEERSILANARAWCLLVHGDLGHLSRLYDPFVLADAERFVEVARHPLSGQPVRRDHAGPAAAPSGPYGGSHRGHRGGHGELRGGARA